MFSGSPGRYRVHCAKYGNDMLYFLGQSAPREWVVWDTAVPANGEWEILDVERVGQDGDGKFKIRGHDGQYIKGAASGFTSSGEDGVTEFILQEVRLDGVRGIGVQCGPPLAC